MAEPGWVSIFDVIEKINSMMLPLKIPTLQTIYNTSNKQYIV